MSLDDATRAQVRAADPAASTWVSANAGSGKTRVLTDRVARLLLAGADPARILCLTFTKAAAAEMQDRLFRRLGAWAMLPEAKLAEALTGLSEDPVATDGEALARARRLFARALETPGGLKIQTIHAFCDAVLRRFPLEAGVSPRFRVLEEREAATLADAAFDRVAEEAPEAFDAFATLTDGGERGEVLASILGHPELFEDPPEARDHPDDATLLRDALGPDAPALAALREVMAGAGKSDAEAAETLAVALAGGEGALDSLFKFVLTKTGAPRSLRTFPTKATRAAFPAAEALVATLQDRVLAAREARLAGAAAADDARLHRFARAFLDRYAAAKSAGGLLDFDDLVGRVRRLLTTAEMAGWVLWKLDGGLDHILVDEAQDTSPEQWAVIRALAAEFHAGEGARPGARTLFVVGDEKQSIYSFQGAEPRAFGEMRDHFAARLRAVGEGLAEGALAHSFRSAPPILAFVDAVMAAAPEATDGGAGARHVAFHAEAPGRVTLWPHLPKTEGEEEPPWYEPCDLPAPEHPELQLARITAGEVARLLREGAPVPDREEGPRPMRPGDVLILVRRRRTLFQALIRELKAAGVPVAGADRMRLTEEIAVQDLLAGLRFAATPEDDLSLAAFLRSPLGGLSEDGLFRLAHGRHGTLWQALEGDARWPEATALALKLRDAADFRRPFEALEMLLTEAGGRARLRARLGDEIEEAVDALLDQALAYESVEPPTLLGFLAWLDAGETELKRELERGTGAVRIMTVHGAKGLEAPVVVLPDCAPRNAPQGGAVLDLGGRAGWKQREEAQPAAQVAAEAERKARAAAEDLRLFYVAMTRAESWLILGAAGGRGDLAESWHGRAAAALATLGPTEAAAPEGLPGPALELVADWPAIAAGAETPAPAAPPPLPDWAHHAPPARVEPPQPRAPSDLGGAHALPGAEGDEGAEAMARGTLLHTLIEVLPTLPAPDRAAAAMALAAGAPEAAALIAEAEAVIAAPSLAPLFAPDALIEVEVAATLPALGPIRGRIDRLVVTPTRILAADFKSNRRVPATAEAVPEALLRQMGAYAAALSALYPDRVVETALVWTRTATLMPLPPALTAAALTRAGADG